MSHELRTPMNAILGFAQLMEINPKHPLDESGKESVEQILKGGDHLLAQIESGNFSLSMEPTAPADILEECLVFIRTPADKRGIKVVDDNEADAVAILSLALQQEA